MRNKRNVFVLPQGDVTERDRRNYNGLMMQYRCFREREDTFAPETRARGLIALTADFLDLGMDEAADQLLLEVDRICPNYFQGTMIRHMANDPQFEKMCCKVAEYYGKLLDKAMKGR
jgi:hypothetical protein